MSSYSPPPNADPYVPLPLDVFPLTIRDFVPEAAASIGCDPAHIAVPLLACFAGANGTKRIVRLPDGRTEPATIWAGVIDDGGMVSRRASEAGTAAARRKQLEALARHEAAMQEYLSDLARFQYYKARSKNDGLACNLKPPTKPTASLAEHRVVSHLPVGPLIDRLAASPDGLLSLCKELAGWFARSSRIEDYSAHLHSMWSGTPLVRELAKRTIFIERPSVSIAGRIQPEAMRRLLTRDDREDGLIPLLLVSMPPPPQRIAQCSDAAVNPTTEAKFAELFDTLWAMETPRDELGRRNPSEVVLSPEAHAEWVQFRDRHRDEQAALSGYLAGMWTSLESYVLRFALVIHTCRWAEGQSVDPLLIDAESLWAAVRLADWFGCEARRVYALLTSSVAYDADKRTLNLVSRMGGSLTARQLQQFDWRFRNDSAGARAELDRLAKLGHGHWATSVGGRTSEFVSRWPANDCESTVDAEAYGFEENRGRRKCRSESARHGG